MLGPHVQAGPPLCLRPPSLLVAAAAAAAPAARSVGILWPQLPLCERRGIRALVCGGGGGDGGRRVAATAAAARGRRRRRPARHIQRRAGGHARWG